jgi:hypothetical protein
MGYVWLMFGQEKKMKIKVDVLGWLHVFLLSATGEGWRWSVIGVVKQEKKNWSGGI